jgi:hypothetical protein
MRSDEAIAQARPSSGARELLGDLVLVALSGVTIISVQRQSERSPERIARPDRRASGDKGERR